MCEIKSKHFLKEDRPSEEETAEVGVTSEKVCNEQECGEGPTCWEEVEERLGFAEIGDDHDEEYALQLGLCEAFFLSYALGILFNPNLANVTFWSDGAIKLPKHYRISASRCFFFLSHFE